MMLSVRIRYTLLVLLTGSLLALSGCGNDENAVPKTITDQILTDDQFSLLRIAIQHAELGDALRAENLTLFAPNDAAFRKTGVSTEEAIKKLTKEQVRIVLLHHLLYARAPLASIPIGVNEVQMANQQSAYLNHTNTDRLYLNNAEVTQADLSVSNGVIHVIDRLLLP